MSNMPNSGFHAIDYSLANKSAPNDNGKTTGVINTTAYSVEMKRNADAQVLPFSAQKVNIENNDYIAMSEEDTQIMQVNGTGLNGINLPGGNSSADYALALEESLNATFNDGEFESVVREHIFPCEFRPFGTDPTPIRTHLFGDRTVRFMHNGAFNPSEDAPTAKAIAGSAVVVSPVLNPETNKSGVMVSAATHISDFDMMGGWTHGSLAQSVDNMIYQYNRKMFTAMADVLAGTPDLQTIEYAKLSGKPQDQAEDVLDALSLNLPTHLGGTMDHFAIMVPAKLEAVLERAAQKAGNSDLAELIGCTVCPYDGEDRGVFILPKDFASISFRTTKDGDVVNVILTRDSGRSGFNLELVSVVDVMATGTVKVKKDAHIESPRV